MYESPQSFASKAAIIEALKRAQGTPLTRGELVTEVSRELELTADATASEVASAIEEMKLDRQISSEIVDGVERLRFDVATL